MKLHKFTEIEFLSSSGWQEKDKQQGSINEKTFIHECVFDIK